MPQGLAFIGKQLVKLRRRDVGALQFGPRIFVMVHGVNRADEIVGEAIGCLVVVEGLKGARQNDPTKIKKDSPKHLMSVRAKASLGEGPRAG